MEARKLFEAIGAILDPLGEPEHQRRRVFEEVCRWYAEPVQPRGEGRIERYARELVEAIERNPGLREDMVCTTSVRQALTGLNDALDLGDSASPR